MNVLEEKYLGEAIEDGLDKTCLPVKVSELSPDMKTIKSENFTVTAWTNVSDCRSWRSIDWIKNGNHFTRAFIVSHLYNYLSLEDFSLAISEKIK